MSVLEATLYTQAHFHVSSLGNNGRERVVDSSRKTVVDGSISVEDGETGANSVDIVHLLAFDQDFAPLAEAYLSSGGGGSGSRQHFRAKRNPP